MSPDVIASSGNGANVAYTSLAAFAGSPAAGLPNGYVARSEGGSWLTSPLTPPIAPQTDIGNGNRMYGFSDDFSKQVVSSAVALAPGALDGGGNLYVHDSITGSYQLVVPLGGNPVGSGEPAAQLRFGGASESLDHIYFQIPETLTPSAPTQGNLGNLYLFSGGELSYIGNLPDGSSADNGSKVAGGPNRITNVAAHGVSNDGGRVYWTRPSGGSKPDFPIYLREDGQATLVTERESDGSTQPGSFWYATPDGAQAFITSDDQLTVDSSPSGNDLYRYEAASGSLENLTPGPDTADVLGVLGTSHDSEVAYFMSEGAFTPGATAGDPNIYVWQDGVAPSVSLIGTLASGGGDIVDPLVDGNIEDWRVSPNGQFLGFVTASSITGPNPHPAQSFGQAYLYGLGDNSLACASCPPGAASPTGDASIQSPSNIANFYRAGKEGLSRNVLDSGAFFFDTPDALVGRDTNARTDVYAYRDGKPSLISSGRSSSASFFGDASESGEEIFLLTREQLVGQDQDDLMDLYAAKVDGGLGSQYPEAPPPPCEGDACQGAGSPAPSESEPASREVTGNGNARPAANRNRCAAQIQRFRRVHVVSKRFRARATQVMRRSNGQMPAQLRRKVKMRGTQLKRQRLISRRAAIQCRRGR